MRILVIMLYALTCFASFSAFISSCFFMMKRMTLTAVLLTIFVIMLQACLLLWVICSPEFDMIPVKMLLLIIIDIGITCAFMVKGKTT